MALERHPVPAWVVVGAGTGGTSATIGRYVRYRRLETQVCVVDPENSAFFPAFVAGDDSMVGGGSRIEGIGRPRVEPSFLPRSEEHTSELQSLMRISYAVFCLKKKSNKYPQLTHKTHNLHT